MAAGVLIIREAGGVVTGLDGEYHEITTRTLIASNKETHGRLAEVLAGEAGSRAVNPPTRQPATLAPCHPAHPLTRQPCQPANLPTCLLSNQRQKWWGWTSPDLSSRWFAGSSWVPGNKANQPDQRQRGEGGEEGGMGGKQGSKQRAKQGAKHRWA